MDAKLAVALLCLVACAAAQEVDYPGRCEKTCADNQYCGRISEWHKAAGDPREYACMLKGYWPGNCLNEYKECHEYASCQNSPDGLGYSCSCPEESAGDGHTKGTGCDLSYKPCTNDFDCPMWAQCRDDFTCECKAGFHGDPRTECVDIIDCPHESCDENAICKDTMGGFTCTCKNEEGWYGDGNTCQYMCHGDQDCHWDAFCNKDRMCECREGFEGNGVTCKGKNECDAEENNCHEKAICIDQKNGYTCQCINGYEGDGKNCKVVPRNCREILYRHFRLSLGRTYTIDPDGEGPGYPLKVSCQMGSGGTIFTRLKSIDKFPMPVTSPNMRIRYTGEPRPFDVEKLIDSSGFCKQSVRMSCKAGFSMFPGTTWLDAKGQKHKTWGSNNEEECACGAVSSCETCQCNGEQVIGSDEMQNLNKTQLPVMRMLFDQQQIDAAFITNVGMLQCADKQFNIPKDCHDAKFNMKMKQNGPTFIDPDGPKGPNEPFLVYCDVETYEHAGVARIDAINPHATGPNSKVEYNQKMEQLRSLIEQSNFCSQKIEYNCKNSPLMGADGGMVSGPNGKLGYFPGGFGVQGACGCGATKSCLKKDVKCNCNIMDGVKRKDFGLIVAKADLPATAVTAKFVGADSEGSYTIGPLQCSGKQFGIQPNCEKIRATGVEEDYTYLIDPDGPRKNTLEPFPVECRFTSVPPTGTTVVHHDDEKPEQKPDSLTFDYLHVSKAQLESLKARSTSCQQKIKVGCNFYNMKYGNKAATWTTYGGQSQELSRFMDSCGMDGTRCNCQTNVASAADEINLIEMGDVPATAMSFGSTNEQYANAASSLVVDVGPLVCGETFPTCSHLKKFVDENRAQGEKKLVDGNYAVDPDGPGGVDPFMVFCKFPATIVNIGPGDNKGDVNYDPNNPDTNPNQKQFVDPETGELLNSECFPVKYYDPMGQEISPYQIKTMVKNSEGCKQDFEVTCEYNPVKNRVNYTACDGETYQGVSSFGDDMCTCGETGGCDGGKAEKCNCDEADARRRKDGGKIVNNDRLPVCEVCLTTSIPPQGSDPEHTPPKTLEYSVGQLECSSKGAGSSGKTCQEQRKKVGRVGRRGKEITAILDPGFPVACRITQQPPIGEMITKPMEPSFPPKDDEVDIEVDYISVNMDYTKKLMEENEYCYQVVYMFGGAGKDFSLSQEGDFWYDFGDNKHSEWEELKSGHYKINDLCKKKGTDGYDMCRKYGKPRAFRVSEKTLLPIKGIKLASVAGVGVFVEESTCLDVYRSCQDVVDGPVDQRRKGYVGGSAYVIDPDGPGDVRPFRVTCNLDYPNGNGVTVVEVDKKFKRNKQVKVKGATAAFAKKYPVQYKNAKYDQMDALTKISDFCWQTSVYDCKNAPITGQTGLEMVNGQIAKGFGTANETDFLGCPCALTGTCTEDNTRCECDAGGSAREVGSVTDTDALPITEVALGGMAKNGEGKIRITSLRCSKKPMDPPKTCPKAFSKKKTFGVPYSQSGTYLVSPKPNNQGIKPFMVYCDMNSMMKNRGVSVIHPRPNMDGTLGYALAQHRTRRAAEEVVAAQKDKNQIQGGNGIDGKVEFNYYAPSNKQIRAFIDEHKYCYQTVRFECQNSPLFDAGSHWLTLGHDDKERTFWGNQDPTCQCGKTGECGGLDSAEGQRTRKCNCDAADDQIRADAGVITNKDMLPIGSYIRTSNAQGGSVNMTVGPLICADVPLLTNECALGFHDCHKNAECIDTAEGYRCHCKSGYQGKGLVEDDTLPRSNGRECIDDNECAWNPCPEDATCHNTAGSFECVCKPGFKQVGPMECEEIDECEGVAHNCHPNADCKNLHGSYECRCKEMFRGDGVKSCIPVGQCFCFGDPHCISFDQKWVHHQGDCEYIMAQDGCQNPEERTYRITVEHWKDRNVRGGYYSWIKAVHLQLYNVGYNISLLQNHVVLVNGVAMKQYHNTHIVSVARILDQIKINLITGLELQWDGMDIVEVNVPIGEYGKTCGMCGNFNNKEEDDWTMGPACPALEGQQTDNYDLFGRSWKALDTPAQCTPDCGEQKPSIEINKCNFPKKMVEQECDKLFELGPESPFGECLKYTTQAEIDQFRFSCMMDGCYEEFSLSQRICHFAKAIAQHCNTFRNIKNAGWKSRLPPCTAEKSCPAGKVHLDCGPVEPSTCLTVFKPINSLPTTTHCNDACYCADGTVQDGDKCVPESTCGCFYNDEYFEKGEKVDTEECHVEVTCTGNNGTVKGEHNCPANKHCGVREDNFKRGCICNEGLMEDDNGNCIVDPCHNVVCEIVGAECDRKQNGTCACPKGYAADCGVCEDIDECNIERLNTCDPLAGMECVNTKGDFECKCKFGLMPNGSKCSDIDECKYDLVPEEKKCGAYSVCNNLYGGFDCECCAGYVWNPDTRDCDRDESIPLPGNSECCSCTGSRCNAPGKVCGSDGKTYPSFRAMTTGTCVERNAAYDAAAARVDATPVVISYPGECQSSCSTVDCHGKQHSTCVLDHNNIPQCECPKCENVTTMYESDMVCATNKVTYISICHMQKDSCEHNIETTTEIETIGKPCPPPVPGGKRYAPGPWSDWTPCSEQCKQGTQTRTRDAKGTGAHTEESKPCYNVCNEGPCKPGVCPHNSVCTVTSDESNALSTQCECPKCPDIYEPICGRKGTTVKTFKTDCEMFREACEEGEADFELLEHNACEAKPERCGRIRNFKKYEDENKCVADREVDLGYCYGGCENDETSNNDMCCAGTQHEYKFVVMKCPDGVRKNKFLKQIKSCDCIKNDQVINQMAFNTVEGHNSGA